MPKSGFFWKIYFLIYGFYVSMLLNQALSPRSFSFIYYHTLIAFNRGYWLTYLYAMGMVTLSLLTLVPILLYVLNVRLFGSVFWMRFLVVRIIFECLGHTVEWNFLKSLFYDESLKLSLSLLVLFITTLGPSYWLLYTYATLKVKPAPSNI